MNVIWWFYFFKQAVSLPFHKSTRFPDFNFIPFLMEAPGISGTSFAIMQKYVVQS